MPGSTLWQPQDAPYGELPVGTRRSIACVARRWGINLRASTSYDDWVELLDEAMRRRR